MCQELNQCDVKIAGQIVKGGKSLNSILHYAVFTLLLYHGLLLDYTHRDDNAICWNFCPVHIRFGCHEKNDAITVV